MAPIGEQCQSPTAEILAQVCRTLRQWALEGPPRNPRAAAGALAEELEEAQAQDLTVDGAPEEPSPALELERLRATVLELKSQNEEHLALAASAEQAHLDELQACRDREAVLEADRGVAFAETADRRDEADEIQRLRRRVEALSDHLSSVLSPVSAMCRTRPMESYSNPGPRALVVDGPEITVEDGSGRARKFKTDRVLEGVAQDDLFLAAAPWVEHAALGGNSCVFAYGATGTGKTQSMMGSKGACPGLAHHALRRLIEGQGGGEVRISMLEVYCEQIRDLLAPAEASGQPSLQCSRRDAHGRMLLDCVEVLASKASDAEELLLRGFQNRVTEETLCNDRSSRSHVVLKVQCTSSKGGCLVLVDLAGSENIQRSGADEDAKLLQEAKAINRSLSALADVVEATAKQQSFVPYRNSRLTMLLEEALSASKVLLLVHVSPFLKDATDTAHSLQFASRVRAVDFGAQRLRQDQEERARAAQQRSQTEARQLQTQLEQIKRELAESQKAQTELKQQVSHFNEQLREKQRELTREQELRSKAEEAAREHRHMTRGGSQAAVTEDRPTEVRAAPAARPISPSSRAASTSRLLPPRTSSRCSSTPLPTRPQLAKDTPPLESARPSPLNSCILVETELAEPSENEQPKPVPTARPPLGDRTNSAGAGKDKETTPFVSKLSMMPSPARTPQTASPTCRPLEPATPTRQVTNATPERTSMLSRFSPNAAGAAQGIVAGGNAFYIEAATQLLQPSPSPEKSESPKQPQAPQLRSALRQVPTDFRCRMLRRQELGTAANVGRRVSFSEEEMASSPPRWYLDILEAHKMQAQEATSRGQASTPRALTPPMRKRPVEAPRDARWR